MLDVLEVQDQLKNFSQEQLIKEMQMPSGSIPQFLVLSELNRRRTMSQDLAKRQSADQPTVKEEVVASSGMPMEKASMMAQQMAPNTSMTENTGIASMMPRELPSEEEPIRMSGGGLMNQQAVFQPFIDRMQGMQARLRPSGLQGLGMDIRRQVAGRTDGEVNEFITDVENMAEERFDVNLGQSTMPTPFGGKGGDVRMPRPMVEKQPLRPSVNLSRPISNTPSYSTGVKPGVRPGSSAFGSLMRRMKDGGVIKAQSGMFADIGSAIGSADAPTFSMPPAFATIYNYAKTVLGLDDELARDVANKTIQKENIDKSQLGMFSAKPFGSVEERLSGDDRLAERKALDAFTGGAEMNQLVDQLSEPEVKDVESVADVPDLDLTQVNPLFSAKPFGTTEERMSGFDDALAQRKALDNFTGGREMSDLINQLSEKPEEKVTPSLNLNPLFSAKPFGSAKDRLKGLPKNRNFIPPESPVGKGDPLMVIDLEEPFTDKPSMFQRSDGTLRLNLPEEKLSPIVSRESTDLLGDVSDTSGKLPMTDMTVKKGDEDDAGSGTGLGGGVGGAGSALSDLEAQIDKLKSDREKGRQSEKWFALAEVGLGMLASQSPTVLGALGEGGLRGLKSFREGKKDYDKDMLSYLTTKASIQKTRGDQALKSAYYKGVLENAKVKLAKSSFTQKDLLSAIKDKDKLILDYQTKYPTNKPEDYERKLLSMKAERKALYERLEPTFKPLVVDPDLDLDISKVE